VLDINEVTVILFKFPLLYIACHMIHHKHQYFLNANALNHVSVLAIYTYKHCHGTMDRYVEWVP